MTLTLQERGAHNFLPDSKVIQLARSAEAGRTNVCKHRAERCKVWRSSVFIKYASDVATVNWNGPTTKTQKRRHAPIHCVVGWIRNLRSTTVEVCRCAPRPYALVCGHVHTRPAHARDAARTTSARLEALCVLRHGIRHFLQLKRTLNGWFRYWIYGEWRWCHRC